MKTFKRFKPELPARTEWYKVPRVCKVKHGLAPGPGILCLEFFDDSVRIILSTDGRGNEILVITDEVISYEVYEQTKDILLRNVTLHQIMVRNSDGSVTTQTQNFLDPQKSFKDQFASK